MPGTFSPPPWVSDPDMHHGTCVMHMPWCMPGSLTLGFLWSRWRGKRSRHSRHMRNLFLSGEFRDRQTDGADTDWQTETQKLWDLKLCQLRVFYLTTTDPENGKLNPVSKGLHKMFQTVPCIMANISCSWWRLKQSEPWSSLGKLSPHSYVFFFLVDKSGIHKFWTFKLNLTMKINFNQSKK